MEVRYPKAVSQFVDCHPEEKQPGMGQGIIVLDQDDPKLFSQCESGLSVSGSRSKWGQVLCKFSGGGGSVPQR